MDHTDLLVQLHRDQAARRQWGWWAAAWALITLLLALAWVTSDWGWLVWLLLVTGSAAGLCTSVAFTAHHNARDTREALRRELSR